MAVAVGNVSSASANSANLDWVHTLGAGADLVLIVGLSLPSGVTGGPVMWDGDGVNEALTMLRREVNTGAATVEIWYLVNPSVATGSSEINAVLSSMSQNIGGAITFSGATTPDSDVGSGPDGVTSVSNTLLDAGNDDFVFDVVKLNGNFVMTEGADQTAQWQVVAGGARGAGSTQDGVFDEVMSWSWSSSSDVAHAACRIPASAAAAAPFPPWRRKRSEHANLRM